MTRFSIITPVFNAAETLEECVGSVLEQTETDFELILADDGSIDGSRELIRELSRKDGRIQVLELNQNSGPARARNEALQCASGRYIAFLDSDDYWLPDKLERQLAFMQKTGSVLTYSGYHRVSENGLKRGTIQVPDSVDYDGLLKTNVIGMLTAVYDRKQLGLRLLPDILKRQDYALWLSILREGHVAYGINEPLAVYRVRNASVSRNKIVAARYQWRVYRELEGLSLVRCLWYFVHYTYNGLRKNRI